MVWCQAGLAPAKLSDLSVHAGQFFPSLKTTEEFATGLVVVEGEVESDKRLTDWPWRV